MTATATCPSADRSEPNWQFDFIDFPTGWYLAEQGLLHTNRRCSYIQTWGGSLCDCGAIQREWERRTGKRLQ
ncbi:hypothetical protein MED01_002470 [Micromonospora sp. MED01]|uniref:hypothetical protein n=1 Tax=Micromonospora alfalfae TaxID=2911212 RepID=UPI001EE79F74|nr:hypothetical protein [Micromonospora alfalfae]MCG5464304.1 hypothetical protein [Micromonospora alfalfae]